MLKSIVADDSKTIRMLLVKILQNFGYEVSEAEDGEEVVELSQMKDFDLIIMDYRLPVMDGIDAMYKIRNSHLEKQPKIIFCSALQEEDKINEALSSGADDYIIKPFDEEILACKMKILGLL